MEKILNCRIEKKIPEIFGDVPDILNFLTVKQAANYLSLSERTIRRLYMTGELEYFKFGRPVRFSKNDLDEYAMKRKVG